MNNEFEEILNYVPDINPERKYWLVRTSSGTNYESFRDNGFIGIGWNEVILSDIYEIAENPTNLEIRNRIKEKIVSHHESESAEDITTSPAYQSKSLSQIYKFVFDIKKGDVVVIPSYNSDLLLFGEVSETSVWLANDMERLRHNCSFIKRKKVRWMKEIHRETLEPSLYKFIFAHQTLNDVSDYSIFINNLLFDFYSLGELTSLVLRLKNQEEIDAYEIGVLYNDITSFIYDFSDYLDVDERHQKFTVKLNLQSPGTIVLVGIVAFGLFAIAFMTVLAGGESGFEIDPSTKKIKFNFKSNSFLEKWSNYLNERDDRKFNRIARMLRLNESLKKFEVQENEVIKELMEPDQKSLGE